MLARLSPGEANASGLAQPFQKSLSLPAVTKHVKVLERAGLITRSKDAQWPPCKLRRAGLRNAADWVEQYRVFWEESLDRSDAYFMETTAKTTTEGLIVAIRQFPSMLRVGISRGEISTRESIPVGRVAAAGKNPRMRRAA